MLFLCIFFFILFVTAMSQTVPSQHLLGNFISHKGVPQFSFSQRCTPQQYREIGDNLN